MVTFNGPAATGWKPFGALGQTPASITPAGGSTEPEKTASGLPKVAETLALLAAGGAVVYFIMLFAGGSGHSGEYR